jgi:hypothetical protein
MQARLWLTASWKHMNTINSLHQSYLLWYTGYATIVWYLGFYDYIIMNRYELYIQNQRSL